MYKFDIIPTESKVSKNIYEIISSDDFSNNASAAIIVQVKEKIKAKDLKPKFVPFKIEIFD